MKKIMKSSFLFSNILPLLDSAQFRSQSPRSFCLAPRNGAGQKELGFSELQLHYSKSCTTY